MKKLILFALLLIPTLSHAASKFNPFTGKPDFVVKSAGSLVDVSTAGAVDGNCWIWSAANAQFEPGACGGGSGTASSLAVKVSSVAVSSPTAVINFEGAHFDAFTGGASTAQVRLDISSVTLQGPTVSSVTVSSFYSNDAVRTRLGLAIGTDVQALDATLTDLAAAPLGEDNSISVGAVAAGTLPTDVMASSVTVSAFYSNAAVRSGLGLAIGSDVQAYDADLDDLADGSLTASKVAQNAGTDISADLEEEAHASEHQDGGADEIAVTAGMMNTGTNASATTFWRGDNTWATPDGGAGGGSSSLAVTTGGVNGMSVITSSPTAIINFSSDTFKVQLTGGATAFVTILPSSVTMLGPSIETAELPSGATLDTEWDTAAEINAATTDNDFSLTTHTHAAGTLDTDSVSADELNATGVEAELEAVLDLNELQGTIGDAQIAAGAVDGGNAGEIADGSITADDLGADSVASSELNATDVEAELEAVMDLQDMQGAVTDGQVPNTITVDVAATANAGDSATAFFSAGTIEDARLPTSMADKAFTGSINIPNGTNPTVDAAGELAVDTTVGQLLTYNGSAAYVLGQATSCFTMTVSSGSTWDNIAIPGPRKPFAYTITNVTGVVNSGTSVTFNLEERASASEGSAGTDVFSSDQVADTNNINLTAFSNASIAANAKIYLTTGSSASSGAVEFLSVDVCYTWDRQ